MATRVFAQLLMGRRGEKAVSGKRGEPIAAAGRKSL